MYKKLLILGAIIFIVMALLPAFVKPNIAFSSGENEIEIASIEDFAVMTDGTTANYKLIADLDFSEISKTYKPINFCGTLNGNGHSLNNLNLTSENSAALFFSIKGATISNLVINNFQVYSNSSAGALAVIIENSTLNNVKVNLGTCYINGTEGAGKLAAVVKDCKFIDVVVTSGYVNGKETDKLSGVIENTTQETTKTEENKKDPEEPGGEEENKTSTELGANENKNENSDNHETSGDSTGENKQPVGEGSETGDTNITTPPLETGEPNVPTPSVPPAELEVNKIVSIDVSNSQIVVNEVSVYKIIIICVLAIMFVVYGFVETPLKNWLKKYFPKRKTKNK